MKWIRPIWAVAVNSFQGCFSAHTTFVIVGAFVAVIVLVGFVDVVDAADQRAQLVAVTAHGAAWLFTAAALILLGATSLSGEIVDHRIYSILTRPISRWRLVLGKGLGLMMVAAVLFGSMQLVGYGLTRYFASREGASHSLRVDRQRMAWKVTLGEEQVADWLEAESAEEARWWFGPLKSADLPDGQVRVKLTNLPFQSDAKDRRQYINPQVRLTAWWNGKPVGTPVTQRLYRGKELEVTLADQAIAPALRHDGKLEVRVACLTRSFRIGLRPKRLLAVAGEASYGWNWFKAAAVGFLGLMALAALAVLSSTFLSPPIAALLAGALFFAGTQVGFVQDHLEGLRKQELRNAQMAKLPEERLEPPTALESTLEEVQKTVLWGIVHLFPNFDQFNDPQVAVKKRLDLPADFVLRRLGWGALYTVVGLIVASLFFRFREVG